MKIPDLKKYFFSYIYIILGLTFIIFFILSSKFEPPYLPNDEPTNFDGYRFYPYTIIMTVSFILHDFIAIALLLEILIRKFVVEKFFPYFKIPLKFNLSFKSNRLLSILFYILFCIASVPLLLTILATIATTLDVLKYNLQNINFSIINYFKHYLNS